MITTATKTVGPDAPDAPDQTIPEEMRKRFLEWQQVDSEFLQNADREMDFLAGEHWINHEGGEGRDLRKELQNAGRSALTIDLLTPSVDLITNQVRINKPTATFIPVGGKASAATADVRQGLYRNIEREFNAAVARETAYQMAVSVGRGYWRVTVEDEEGPTFAQRIGIRRIIDLKSVAMDGRGIEFDYSDANWCMFWDDVPKEEFRAEWGDEPDVTGSFLPEAARDPWFRPDTVRVVEYFRKVWKKRIVARLSKVGDDGSNIEVWEDELSPEDQALAIARTEKLDYVLERYKLTGERVLKKFKYKGRFLPLVVCVGREVFRGHQPQIHSGMVKPAMDISRVHNFMESRLVDEVALSPLPHVFAATGSLTPKNKALLNDINKHPWSVIEFETGFDANGMQIPKPEWAAPSANVGAIVAGAAHAKDNLQRILNTYAPQLGVVQGDQSGRAIREVKDQGDISHAAFPDNYRRSCVTEARIVNDLMDVVYTEKRAITISKPDDSVLNVLINQAFVDDKGQQQHHLFGSGKYDVAVDTGPAYPTRMAEAGEKLIEAMKVLPQIAQAAPDIAVKALNLPPGVGDKLAERLTPPGMLGKDGQPVPPAVAALMQQLQQAQAFIAELKKEITTKAMDLESRMKIAELNGRVQIALGLMKAGETADLRLLEASLEEISRQTEAITNAQTEPATQGA